MASDAPQELFKRGEGVWFRRSADNYGGENWERVEITQDDGGPSVGISRWNGAWGRLQTVSVLRGRLSRTNSTRVFGKDGQDDK